ncbi:type IV secretory system conjugative DNA transfer family protein [Streptomyces sp. TRM49041]|uniref:type IV secretory system conjugative DNA transfer family protein n=1 Tax=Streptomyces sp. TRM49041 TaxID=2603216 RepID=UPI0011EEB59A|nr:type IV secretory system conjugative DNA transfer family protein [Streptomyces sp. TRM49041]
MERKAEERGIPDGLLVGLLGFLLGVTLLAWTATGLAGLLTRGGWPEGVTFTQTPLALRSLVTDPHDLATAWPTTPAEQLPGYGVFWGLLIGELMVLIVLTVFVLGTVARWRAVRARARTERQEQAAVRTKSGGRAREEQQPKRKPEREPDARTTEPAPVRAPRAHPHPQVHATAQEHAPAPDSAPAQAPAQEHTGEHTQVHAQPLAQEPTPGQAPGPAPAPPPPPAPPTRGTPTALPAATVPSPRTPRLLYGDSATRRPSALQAIQDAEGPALVVTSDPTVWADTKNARAKIGPVLLYDPGHLCDTPARLHWSPTDGCEDTATAAGRAAALLAPVRPRARMDAAVADTAETLLRCWLHAAAVDGRAFKQVHRWAQNNGTAHEPVRILRTHPKATNSHAGLLESALTAYPERREMAQELTVRALSALTSVHIREACTPNRTDSLTLESFIHEGGTLYVVGEAIEDPRAAPGAMPLLTALASHVVEHGRRMAARSSDGRLDPPMSLVLDDVAAVAPLPRLPELLATGHDQGLPTLVLLRSQEQARARWPEPLAVTSP